MFLIKNIIKILFLLSIFIINVNADEISVEDSAAITSLRLELVDINKELEKNIWITRYNNYLTYRKIEKELTKIKTDAKKYGRWKGEKYKELSYQLRNKIKIKENELELISEYKDSPIGKKIKPSAIGKPSNVTNPFLIIEAMTYIQQLQENVTNYQEVSIELAEVLEKLQTKINVTKELYKLSKDEVLKKELDVLELGLKDFVMIVDIVSTTGEVYGKKVTQTIQEVKDSISDEIWHSIKLLLIVFVLFLITVISKKVLKRYIEDDDKHYTSNKLVNFIFIVIVLFTVLFSYIDNVSYLVTILGFASAGIAIALKDWFMSIFGWISIMLSGSINPGDRIKVTRDGVEVVGDVLDITLLKIAIREDTTLTSYSKNRRTGRVFFIPNNYVFTDMIANYTFDGLRTVWDVVDINITFDSNHKKAVALAKGVVTTQAKGYTDLARKRLNNMRKKYVLRNSNPEPRVFAFAENYSITISSWFHTNSHATLGLRSAVGMEILEAFKAADDITIAYPTQTFRMTGDTPPAMPESLASTDSSNSLFDTSSSTHIR